MSERRILFACDLDSQVFGALPIALAFAARGWSVTFAIESSRTLPKPVLERLAGQFGLIERAISALPTDEEAFRHDAIGVFVTGSRLALFRHVLELAARVRKLPRPALYCGFNGLVFEKFEEGVAWRLGYDVIGLNGPRDRDAFVDFLHATDFSSQPSVIVGLRRKTDAPQRPLKIPSPAGGGERREPAAALADAAPFEREDPLAELEPSAETEVADDVALDVGSDAAAEGERSENGPRVGDENAAPRKLFVFAEQVVVPRTLRERQSLVATLARLARASPGWEVALKARVRPDEQTFHSQPNHISKLVRSVRDKPANLYVTYEPLDALLDRADLFATISSTALFDAFDYGVPSMVATDFGLRNADGAHVFFASGLLVRLCDLPSLDDAPIHSPDARWMRRMGYGDPYSPAALVDWMESFNPARPLPRSFVSFPAAASVASASRDKALALCAAFARVEEALAAQQAGADAASVDGERSSPLAELTLLGFAVTEALTPGAQRPARTPAASGSQRPKQEGPVAALSRRIGVYWIYKRTRLKLGLPIYAPRG